MKGFAALLTLATVGGLALPGVGRGQAPLLDHLAFDGQDDCVSVPYSASFPSLIFTASAWIKTEASPPYSGNKGIVSRGEDDLSDEVPWGVFLNAAGQLTVVLENAGGPEVYASVGDPEGDGEWHHVVAARDASGVLTLYVDGVADPPFSPTISPSLVNDQTLTIGCNLGNSGAPPPGGHVPAGHFPGRIDEVALWSSALEAAEVTSVFLGTPEDAGGGLVSYWPFSECAGQTAGDTRAAGNDGTLGFDPAPGPDDPQWSCASTVVPATSPGGLTVLVLLVAGLGAGAARRGRRLPTPGLE